MSQENVEIVARLVDAWNQANVEAMLALFDPECEVIFPSGEGGIRTHEAASAAHAISSRAP